MKKRPFWPLFLGGDALYFLDALDALDFLDSLDSLDSLDPLDPLDPLSLYFTIFFPFWI